MKSKRLIIAMLFLISFLILTLLFGCGSRIHRSMIAKEAKTSLIGKSKMDILLCAGTPVRTHTEGGLEFYTFYGGGDGGGNGERRYCEATFIFQDNKVVKLHYAGKTGGKTHKDDQCAYVVGNCLTD